VVSTKVPLPSPSSSSTAAASTAYPPAIAR
jgi:hypothetical protein